MQHNTMYEKSNNFIKNSVSVDTHLSQVSTCRQVRAVCSLALNSLLFLRISFSLVHVVSSWLPSVSFPYNILYPE